MTIERPMFPPPGKPQEGLYYPTPVTPEEAFQAIGRLIEDLVLEERLDAMIDRAIRRLAQGKMMKQVAGLTTDYPERAPSVPLKIVGPKKKRAKPKTK